jgi:hypothetical protein
LLRKTFISWKEREEVDLTDFPVQLHKDQVCCRTPEVWDFVCGDERHATFHVSSICCWQYMWKEKNKQF